MNIYVLYRDIRTYGEREYLYREARQAGIIFIRYALGRKPRVKIGEEGLEVEVVDHILNRSLLIKPDLVSLATAIVPYRDEQLAQLFKVPVNEDGFFVEAHAKLGPSEFATDGVFLCGMAHYPKPIDESVAQAQSAASRAITLLARQRIQVSGTIAQSIPSCAAVAASALMFAPTRPHPFWKKDRFPAKPSSTPFCARDAASAWRLADPAH